MEAQEYEKLVKALRCPDFGDVPCSHPDCNYWSVYACKARVVITDAADAIEALRKRLVSTLTALHLANEKMGYYGIQPYTEADGDDMISDWVKTLVHEELEQQLPKRGEWIWDDKRCIYVCSVCGSPKVRENMDRQIIKEQAYCYSCGAKMDGKEKDDE